MLRSKLQTGWLFDEANEIGKTVFVTKVINDESQVPAGYVRLTDYRKVDEAAAKAVSGLHNEGIIPAVKLMRTIQDKTGPVWVSKQHADDALTRMRTSPECSASSKQNIQAEILVELRRIASSMERLEQVWSPAKQAC